MKLSVLDLIFLLEGQTPSEAVAGAISLARFVEGLGFERYWIAEHHDSPGLGSSAPEILIAAVALATTRLRVGSGGIMLPNHSALHMAEVFRTLEALAPGRIDLGVGRAPGTDRRASAALRRGAALGADDFPQQVADLEAYLRDELPVRAIPLGGGVPPIWMLGSSDFGARLAAERGLPYAFAQHFSRMDAGGVLTFYKNHFIPSIHRTAPLAAMGCHVICADTDEEAEELALSSDFAMSRFLLQGRSAPLLPPERVRAEGMTTDLRERVREHFPKFVGSPETIRRLLAPYREVADELIVSCAIFDPRARQRSYRLLRDVVSP